MRTGDQCPHRTRRHQHREQCAGQRFEDPAIGAEVGAILPGGSPQDTEPDRGGDDACPGERADGEQALPRPLHDQSRDHEYERPDEIELLLDGKRPHVLQRARDPVAGEVRARRDEMPVRDVEESCRDVAAQTVASERRGHDCAPHQHGGDHNEEGGNQAAHPPGPEVEDLDVTAFELSEQKRGDQVPAQNEEDIDAQETGGRVGQTEVKGHHRGNGEQAHAVERVVAGAPGRACRQYSPHRLRHPSVAPKDEFSPGRSASRRPSHNRS